VNDLGKKLLASTTFPTDKHRNVGGSNLPGDVNRAIKACRVSDDAESLFY
jgi:hypothetical protein